MELRILMAGRLAYPEALALQERLMALRQLDQIGDTLMLVEHPPVLTLGRRGGAANILLSPEALQREGVSVHEVSRGGDVTYHGPGQIVGYPIMDLRLMENDIKKYVWNVEEVFIRLLFAEFGIDARREEKKYTGVWVGDDKITAIGISVSRHITMHGFAFNVNTDLSHFKWINPCGITDKGVSSLQKLLGRELDMAELNGLVAKYFCVVFDRTASEALL